MGVIIFFVILYLANEGYKKYKINKRRNLTKNLIISIYSRGEENDTPERREKLEHAARMALFHFQIHRGELFDR